MGFNFYTLLLRFGGIIGPQENFPIETTSYDIRGKPRYLAYSGVQVDITHLVYSLHHCG